MLQGADVDAGGLENRTDTARQSSCAWRVSVHADRVGDESQRRTVNRNDPSLGRNQPSLPRYSFDTIDHRARTSARHEGTIRLVSTIGKCLGSHAKAGISSRLDQTRAGETHQPQTRVGLADRIGNGCGEGEMSSSLVVQRAMWLHVNHSHASGRGHGHEQADLITNEGGHGDGGEGQLTSAAPVAICIAGVRPYRDALRGRGRDCSAHRLEIAGVCSTGDVDRGHHGEHGKFGSAAVVGVGLAQVGVQVNLHGSLAGSGRVLPDKRKGHREKRDALLPATRLPSTITAPLP